MSFNENYVNKVNTIVKYSKVIIQDTDEQFELKGVVGDYVKYPETFPNKTLIINNGDMKGTVHLLFDHIENKKLEFKEEDTYSSTFRNEIFIPEEIKWTLSKDYFEIESSIELYFDLLLNCNNEKVIITNSYTTNNTGYNNYKIVVEGLKYLEFENEIVPCRLFIYEDVKKTKKLLDVLLFIEVIGSSMPGGD